MAEELGGSEFGELEGVADEIEDVAAKHGVFLEGLAVVGDDATVALHTAGRCAPRAHRHEIEVEVTGLDTVDIDETQHVFEIRRHLEIDVEGSVSVIDAFPAIEGGVGGLVAHLHHPSAEELRGVIPHVGGQIVIVDEMYVTIDSIDIRICQFTYYPAEHIIGRIKIIGIKNSDDLSVRHSDTLVHGVIQPLVAFTYPLQPPLILWLILTYDVNGIVLRTAINNYMLPILTVLTKNAFDSVAKSRTAIPGSGDDGYFHRKRLIL